MKQIYIITFVFITSLANGQYNLILPYNGFRIGNVESPTLDVPLMIKNSNISKIEFSGLNPYFTFYENNNFIGYFQTISNTFEIGTKNASDMKFRFGGQSIATFEGSTGKLTIRDATSFQGGLRLIGAYKAGSTENPGTFGQVLRSRGVSNTPIWSDFSYDPQIGFSAVRNTNFSVGYNTGITLGSFAITFQDTPSTGMDTNGKYTVPSSGFYHFNCNIPYFEWTNNANGNLKVELRVLSGTQQKSYYCDSRIGSFGMGLSQDGKNCGFDVKLQTGDIVDFILTYSTSTVSTLSIPSTSLPSNQRLTISGYKVY